MMYCRMSSAPSFSDKLACTRRVQSNESKSVKYNIITIDHKASFVLIKMLHLTQLREWFFSMSVLF